MEETTRRYVFLCWRKEVFIGGSDFEESDKGEEKME